MPYPAESKDIAPSKYMLREIGFFSTSLRYHLFVAFLLGAFSSAGAAVIAAHSGSLTDVTKAVQSATNGDTVTIPLGTYSWTGQLTITKNITLKGASAFPFTSRGTVILDDITGSARTANGAALIKVLLTKDTPLFRLCGIEFRNGPTTKTGNLQSEIAFAGSSVSSQNPIPRVVGESLIRMDNCKFADDLHNMPVIFRDVIGVVDHVVRSGHNEFAQVYMINWNGKDNGHGSWADDPYWGTDKFLFFEDCQFTNTVNSLSGVLYGIDLYAGARVVSRHNSWHNAAPTAHGTEGAAFRGGKQWEIYNDTYKTDLPRSLPQLRSGSVIMHDNKCTNIVSTMSFQLYALSSYPIRWGKSTGWRPWDCNAPRPTTGYYASGTHSGPNGSTLIDKTAKWMTDQWVSSTASYVVINVSAPLDANGDPPLAPIAGNEPTYLVHNNSRVTFKTGDRYQIWKVVTSLDQAGQGKGALLTGGDDAAHIISGARTTGGTARSQPYPRNFQDWPQRGYPLEPCYSWNNVSLGGTAGTVPPSGEQINFGNAQPTFLREGRDYFNKGNVGGVPQRIGSLGNTYTYVPYTYPHPLTK